MPEDSVNLLSEHKPDKNKMLNVYCPVVDREVPVAKWYDDKKKGDVGDIGNPEVYFLMCDQPYKLYMERSGSFGQKRNIVQDSCGQNRRCPVLQQIWHDEIGGIETPARPQTPVQPFKPAAKTAVPRKEKKSTPADADYVVAMEELVGGLILNTPYSRRVAHFLRIARGVLNIGDYQLMVSHIENAKRNTRSNAEANSVDDVSEALEELYFLKHGKPDKKV